MLKELVKKNIVLYKILKPAYHFALSTLDYLRRVWYVFSPNSGMQSYQKMQ